MPSSRQRCSSAGSASAGSSYRESRSGSMARWRGWRAASRRDASPRGASAHGTSSSRLTRRRLAEMPKTLTGAELQLDDAPVRGSDLFLVDGNNLAYRAFFALPEELATSEGFSTNALLGFTNMLFKLLSDYRPKGVAVAWDTRPVHRAATAEAAEVVYKEGRRPMPDLLREQFPHFRPIVSAFGYSNLEFDGWEADDVIATLASRADAAGVRTCVVSTDRDAFQLCSANVCLMMTPRGVSDVHVGDAAGRHHQADVRGAELEGVAVGGDDARADPGRVGARGQRRDHVVGLPAVELEVA